MPERGAPYGHGAPLGALGPWLSAIVPPSPKDGPALQVAIQNHGKHIAAFILRKHVTRALSRQVSLRQRNLSMLHHASLI